MWLDMLVTLGCLALWFVGGTILLSFLMGVPSVRRTMEDVGEYVAEPGFELVELALISVIALVFTGPIGLAVVLVVELSEWLERLPRREHDE